MIDESRVADVGALSPRAGVALLTLQLRSTLQEAVDAEAEVASVDVDAALWQLRSRLGPLMEDRRQRPRRGPGRRAGTGRRGSCRCTSRSRPDRRRRPHSRRGGQPNRRRESTAARRRRGGTRRAPSGDRRSGAACGRSRPPFDAGRRDAGHRTLPIAEAPCRSASPTSSTTRCSTGRRSSHRRHFRRRRPTFVALPTIVEATGEVSCRALRRCTVARRTGRVAGSADRCADRRSGHRCSGRRFRLGAELPLRRRRCVLPVVVTDAPAGASDPRAMHVVIDADSFAKAFAAALAPVLEARNQAPGYGQYPPRLGTGAGSGTEEVVLGARVASRRPVVRSGDGDRDHRAHRVDRLTMIATTIPVRTEDAPAESPDRDRRPPAGGATRRSSGASASAASSCSR